MSIKENQTSKFLHSIDKYSKRRRLKIAEEIRQIEEKRLKDEELKIIQDAKDLMMSELNMVRSSIFVKVSSARIVFMQRISQKKQEIKKVIFDVCESRIKDFTKSSKYEKRLADSIDLAIKILGKSMKILARKQDINYIKQDSLHGCEINSSSRIKYGGLIFTSKGIVLDDTFDSRIYEQKNLFLERFF